VFQTESGEDLEVHNKNLLHKQYKEGSFLNQTLMYCNIHELTAALRRDFANIC